MTSSWVPPTAVVLSIPLESLLSNLVTITFVTERRWEYLHESQGKWPQKWTIEGFLPFRIFLERLFTQRFADSQGWQARGPQPLHPLRTPVQGDPVGAAMAVVRAEAKTAPSSATYAWIQPRTPSSACVATSSGQYPCCHLRGLAAKFGKPMALCSLRIEDFSLSLGPNILRPKGQKT